MKYATILLIVVLIAIKFEESPQTIGILSICFYGLFATRELWLRVRRDEIRAFKRTELYNRLVEGVLWDRISDPYDNRVLDKKRNKKWQEKTGVPIQEIVDANLIFVPNERGQQERYERVKAEEAPIFWRYVGEDGFMYITQTNLAEFLGYAVECGGFSSPPLIATTDKVDENGNRKAIDEGIYFPNRRYQFGKFYHHILGVFDPKRNEYVDRNVERYIAQNMLIRGERLEKCAENTWKINETAKSAANVA